ncbi:hypothetical protein OBBRIDRAFT_410484 [Obba rivulosa]|uniref:Uncharacterized protein n=1 Tax=Obba rivulosa TaxID=1052685 RepID=A0A8E2B2E0_9APHY|nr:hypothetical protein OBBRIDRAFT_410484 [Obba rivulosa]
MRCVILLRLDEFAVGGITPSSLDRFVGDGTIQESIDRLWREHYAIPTASGPVNPLLVWVDDNPDYIEKEVENATRLGITVYSLPSTAAAKAWIDANQEMLWEAEAAHRLRFISDNYRMETGRERGDFLNLSAGETILRYLRGRLFAAPVLIYCGASIPTTRYVLSYKQAGSTVSYDVCMAYITALADGRTDDTSWEDFDVKYDAYVAQSLSQPQRRVPPGLDARHAPVTPTPVPNRATAGPAAHRAPPKPVLERAPSEWSPVSEWVECELPVESKTEAAAETRLSRFSDWSDTVEALCRIGPAGGSARSFFSGGDVASRMSQIREAITHIRLNWADYDQFMEGLQRMFIDTTGGEKAAPLLVLLPLSKDWADRRRTPVEAEDYSVLKLYTSERGYQAVFRVLNEAFRKDDLTGNQSRLQAAVFLIELLTIELFNYTLALRPPSSFSGVIYRGLCLNREHLNEFYALTKRPVKDRYWSIPLSIMSCTTDLLTAVKFAEKLASSNSNLYPVLWRIHVADLDPELLEVYHRRFPASVVSTICAVRISDLSDYPEEEEVLLRGPFFQLVNVQPQRLVGVEGASGTVHVMDGVMLNSNRDHPSTMEMAPEEGNKARELFGCLVEIGRTRECLRLAEQCALHEDVLQYAQVCTEAEGRLARLLQ